MPACGTTIAHWERYGSASFDEGGTTVKSTRQWIWWAISLQALGYLIDIVWHRLVSRGVEPSTLSEMARHLATVHLSLYLGCASVLVATAVALIHRPRESRREPAPAMAFAGAALSAAAEAWHAYSHLQLDTHHAPIAGILSVIGFVVVVVATLTSPSARERDRTRGSSPLSARR
jgi:hypothetical protein